MPIYEFVCNKCKHKFEELVKLDLSDAPKQCPKCKHPKIKKIISASSFDVVGGYDYQYGKKNWKKGKSNSEIADVLTSKKDPY